MKPPTVSSKKDTLAPFVILMTAYLSLNSVLNLSNKYALVREAFPCFLPVAERRLDRGRELSLLGKKKMGEFRRRERGKNVFD